MSTTQIKFIDPISTPVVNTAQIAAGDKIDTALFKLQSQLNTISGGTTNSGSATIVFSSDHIGANEASVVVTGQTNITQTSKIQLYVDPDDSTSTHTAKDHRYIPLFAHFTAGNIVNNTSFTIYGVSMNDMTGSYVVRWIWS
jgi:hypothetical protein